MESADTWGSAVLVLELDAARAALERGAVYEAFGRVEAVRTTLRARLQAPAPPTPTATIADDGRLRDTKAAAEYLDCSEDEVRERVRRGELRAHQRVPKGRYHFTLADLEDHKARLRMGRLATDLDQRYTPPHDTARGQNAAAPARLDTAPAGRRAQRDHDDSRALGTRRARRHPPRSDEPFTPGQAAWALPHPGRPPTRPRPEG